MRIVCIIGAKGTNKKEIADRLTRFGYYKTISYTTREQRSNEINSKDYYFVSKSKFMDLVSKGVVMEWEEIDGNYYGSPHPIGIENNVIVTDIHGFESIKDVYGEQVIGVYVQKNEEDTNNKCDICIEEGSEALEAVQKILEYVHQK